jgi:hypothetical protein
MEDMCWLRCEISLGQFSGEFGIHGKLHNNASFGLFASEEDLRFDGQPTENTSAEGWLRVVPLAEKGDLLLVGLPQPTLENGQIITVTKDQVRSAGGVYDPVKR